MFIQNFVLSVLFYYGGSCWFAGCEKQEDERNLLLFFACFAVLYKVFGHLISLLLLLLSFLFFISLSFLCLEVRHDSDLYVMIIHVVGRD